MGLSNILTILGIIVTLLGIFWGLVNIRKDKKINQVQKGGKNNKQSIKIDEK